MPGLSDDELRAVAYFAVGVSSEGKDVAYQLSFAGKRPNAPDGTALLKPVGNSGYSVGQMQTDLGQHPDDAKALVAAYQRWAERSHTDWVLTDTQQAHYASDLGRDGRHIRDPEYDVHDAAHVNRYGTHIASDSLPVAGRDLDSTFKRHLDSFLASDDGKSFVHALDTRQVEDIVDKVAKPLNDRLAFYPNASTAEQTQIFAVVAKAYNQSQKAARELLNDMGRDKINSLADVKARIDTYPNYMRTGRDAALAGAEVFNALQVAGAANPIREAWQDVKASPLASPVHVGIDLEHAHLTDHYAAVKALFVQPAQGVAMVAALEHSGSYSYGDPARASSRGFYADGGNFLQWDRDDRGRGFVGGQWFGFQRDGISLQRNADRMLDVVLTHDGRNEPLLHIAQPAQNQREAFRAPESAMSVLHLGARGESVAAMQADLAGLGYTARNGQALRTDGNFGTETLRAVEAFQRDHALVVDGKAGPLTHAALRAATDVRRMEAAVQCDAPAPLMTFSDSAHPQHALYAALQGLLPAGTSEARLAQATAACHRVAIDRPEDLRGVHSDGHGRILFTSDLLFAATAEVDVSRPAPSMQQSLRDVLQFDQQQAQMQQQATHGPVGLQR